MLMPFAIVGALCMGACSLLSNGYELATACRAKRIARPEMATSLIIRPVPPSVRRTWPRRSNILYLPQSVSCAQWLLNTVRASISPGNGSKQHGVLPQRLTAQRLGRSGVQTRSALARLRGHTGFWLKALSQPSIDLTLRTHAGLSTRIVESPGLSLSEAELEALVSQLRIVAAKTLPNENLTYGIFSGERERMSRAIVTLISEEATGRPIAFNALSVMDVELDARRRRSPISASSWSTPMCAGRGFHGFCMA